MHNPRSAESALLIVSIPIGRSGNRSCTGHSFRGRAAATPRSSATMPGFRAGRPPRSKGLRYPADPPTVEEIVAVMRIAGDGLHGRRLRGLVVMLWRAGLRIDEALALREADLDRRRGALLVRRGKGGRRPRSEWTTGLAGTRALAHRPRGAADRSPVLRHQRTHARTPMDDKWCACRAPARRRHGRRSATLCSPPAAARPRCRDGP